MQKLTYTYIFFLSLLLASYTVQAQRQTYSQLHFKAAILQRFVKYTTFPPEAFKNTEGKIIRLGILGNDPFGSMIERIVSGRPVHERNWVIKRSNSIKELWGCHIIFVCDSEEERIKDITTFYGQYPVLTVGDNLDRFVECGGIVNFTKSIDGKFGFELNAAALKKTKLSVDVRVFNLAKKISNSLNCE